MINSKLIDTVNKVIAFTQLKLFFLSENSVIIKNLDKIILFFIIFTIFMTMFAPSGFIGCSAFIVSFLSLLKLFITKGQKIELKSFDGALTVYFLFCLISTINSTMMPESFYGLLKTFLYLSFYFSVVQYLRYNTQNIFVLVLGIAVVGAIQAFIGIGQEHFGIMAGATWQDVSRLNPEEVLTRVFGSLNPSNPNLYGGYMLMSLWVFVCAFWVCFTKKRYYSSIVFCLLFISAVASIFFSGCRGAYLGLGIFIFCGIFLTYKILKTEFTLPRYFKRLWWSMIGAIVIVVSFIIVSTPALFKRILSIFTVRGDSSSSFRMNVYTASFEMFKDNWFLGIGCGNKVFREIYGLYMISGFDALSAYCIYLEIGLESGIFALLSFLIFIGLLIKEALRNINDNTKIVTKIISATILLEILAIMIHGIVDTVFFRPQIQILFWTSVAILSVCRKIDNYDDRGLGQ